MLRTLRSIAPNRRYLFWIVAGIVLRALFIIFPRPVDDDTWDYLQLGHNLFHYGVYATGTGDSISPTLFRLPAYPIFLVTFEQLFAHHWPNTWFNSVFITQLIAGVTAALLLASFARRHISPRAGEFTLALAMLCPFTAVYVGIAMTECLTIFAISLGIYAAGRALSAHAVGSRDISALLLAGLASALAALLRPDGVLLLASLAGGLFYYSLRAHPPLPFPQAFRRGLAAASIVSIVALLPLAVWALRNWEQFHVFQPLAPRYLNDPGDRPNVGFYHWMRTWSVEYESTATVFWQVGAGPIDPDDLPARAFDSPRQRAQTLALIAEYNQNHSISPQLDNRFAALAAERIHAHPFSYFVVVPALRVADMLLRPRTEEFGLEVFWWPWGDHPGQTAWAILLGLINLFYVVVAAWAFLRGRVPWPWMLGAYLLLRLLMLGSIENPEPRYTVECFPILIVAAAAALSGSRNRQPHLPRP